MDFKRINKHLQPRSGATTPGRSAVDPNLVRRSMAARTANPQTEKAVTKKPARSRIRKFLLNKRVLVVAGAVIVVVAVIVLIVHLTTRDKPEYQTVLPDNKSIGELGGWQRVSPPGKDPVFAYSDMISGIPVGVSQQPLPASFKGDTAARVADLAKKYNATTEVTAGDTTVYIGTSVKGPQSVIFTKKNLLILIKSQKTIDNSAWKDYVETLGNNSPNRIPKY